MAAAPKPPAGTNFIAAIVPQLTILMLALTWTTLLFPILFALFFFSTKASRRRFVFHLNVFSLLFGICEGLIMIYLHVHNILSPLDPSPFRMTVVEQVLFLFTPLLVESILLVRLVAVYPPQMIGRKKLAMLIAFPIILKIGRIVNMGFAIEDLVSAGTHASIKAWGQLAYAKIEWILQLADNGYVTALFLYRLRARTPPRSNEKFRGKSISSHIRGIFLIALSSYAIPSMLSLAQLILVFAGPSRGDSELTWFLDCTYVMITNCFLSIVGVVFATVWSTGSRWNTSSGLTSEHILPSHSGNTAVPSQGSQQRTKVTVPGVVNIGTDDDTPSRDYRVDFDPYSRPAVEKFSMADFTGQREGHSMDYNPHIYRNGSSGSMPPSDLRS